MVRGIDMFFVHSSPLIVVVVWKILVDEDSTFGPGKSLAGEEVFDFEHSELRVPATEDTRAGRGDHGEDSDHG